MFLLPVTSSWTGFSPIITVCLYDFDFSVAPSRTLSVFLNTLFSLNPRFLQKVKTLLKFLKFKQDVAPLEITRFWFLETLTRLLNVVRKLCFSKELLETKEL
ncbi:hypothetical protein WICPIJ_007464 [Wickerhamomyces pijperi]|uniref:Uncharacterized protein n=1 Tax=Wickerhamomyces pijperi TaxID=599730 RepID=A0A9P8TK28_WICPI|nr:hypothetical protein WICPIJ_007464 [Wickerhamomyces pijperi]